MLTQKQHIPTNLPVKPKSNYVRQFQDFQRRTEKNRIKTKFPSIPLRTRKSSAAQELKGEEYLELAKRIISNKEKLNFWDQKQNDLGGSTAHEEMSCFKSKIGKLKNRISQQSQPLEINENMSHLFTHMGDSKLLRQPLLPHRSRALSNVTGSVRQKQPILRQKDLNQRPNFLTYKKGKRDFSALPNNQ